MKPAFFYPNFTALKFSHILSTTIFLLLISTLLAAGDYRSPQAIIFSQDGKRLFVAENGTNSIAVIDTKTNTVLRRTHVSAPPLALALAPHSKQLLISIDGATPSLLICEAQSCEPFDSVSVGHAPSAVALSRDGRLVFVCNRFDNSVSVIDRTAKRIVSTIPVSREPVDLIVSKDGKFLFIGNHLPVGPANDGFITATVDVVSLEENRVIESISLPNGSTSLRGMALSPDGKFIYVTHILGRYLVPTTQLERGWMNTNVLSIIDVENRKWLNTVLLDDVDLGAANPWGICCTEDGTKLIIALSGTHELMIIDRPGMHDRLLRIEAGEIVSSAARSPEEVQNDLSFLVGLKRRIKLAGKGPRALATAGTMVYAANYFSDSIEAFDMQGGSSKSSFTVPLSPENSPDRVRKGEMLFHDATICFQHWQSCSSCHPDTRADGLNWDLLNDGIGNPKQVKSLLLAHQTPPAMVSGIRASAEVAVRAGIKYILFAVRPPEDGDAIDAYLKSLQPLPSPKLVNGRLSASAKRGQELFKTAGCAACHSGPNYTDQNQYDLGMGKLKDKGVKFDVPTLREVWRTAPYLHDGRAATIMDLLTTCNQGDRHGETSALSREELADLAEYVLSL